ncbi:MAG: hypothetical protein AAF657_41320, partial [Acidobacteriota bacterium]
MTCRCLILVAFCLVSFLEGSPLPADEASAPAAQSAEAQVTDPTKADSKKSKKAKKKKQKGPGKYSLKVVEGWKKRMAEIEKRILNGESERALKDGTKLASEMVNRIRSGESGQILGALNMLRAFAAYNVGDEKQALWHWQISLQMFPALADLDVSRFGDAAHFLQTRPSRLHNKEDWVDPYESAKKELAEAAGSSDEEVKRPRKKRAPQPMFPAAKRGQGHLSVVVSAIIDEEGRPTEPV